MKISISKKQLAKIISENGGWPHNAEFAAQCKSDCTVSFYRDEPFRDGDCWWGCHLDEVDVSIDKVMPNWHQTILSRDEYFHLYPAPDADGWIEWGGGECPVEKGTLIDVRYRDGHEQVGCECGVWRGELYGTHHWLNSGSNSNIIAYRLHKPEQSKSTAVGDDETNLAAKEELEALEFSESPEQRAKLAKIYAPSIEQLAADYHAKLAIAQQAQEEADSHRCGAEAALERLVAAGKALGLVLGVVAPEPVITDWRDLQVGDEIELMAVNGGGVSIGEVGVITQINKTCLLVDYPSQKGHMHSKQPLGECRFRFIRRPAKGESNA